MIPEMIKRGEDREDCQIPELHSLVDSTLTEQQNLQNSSKASKLDEDIAVLQKLLVEAKQETERSTSRCCICKTSKAAIAK